MCARLASRYVQDPLVIFTTKEKEEFFLDLVQKFRRGREGQTIIITQTFSDFAVNRKYDQKFWARQFNIDPEYQRHRGPALYQIWNEKTSFVLQAIDMNPFNSTYFAWADLGYRFNEPGKIINVLPATIKQDQVLVGVTDDKDHNQIGGGFFVGHKDALLRFHLKTSTVLEDIAARGGFIGKDQLVWGSACRRYPDMCYLVDIGLRWYSQANAVRYGKAHWVLPADALTGDNHPGLRPAHRDHDLLPED